MARQLRRIALSLHELATGRRVLACLNELNKTQWQTKENLLQLQREKLQRIVEYAYQTVPYYKQSFDQAGFHPQDLKDEITALRRLPTISKATIRENFERMLTSEPPRRKELSKKSTSGSTGHPLVFMQDHGFRDYVTADIQRHLGWAGWAMGDPHAYIWGASFETSASQALRTRLIDWTWNRFLTNAFLMTEESMTEFAERIRHQRPRLLFGYASGLHRFARFVHSGPYKGMSFDGIFSSAERLLPVVRDYLEDVFQCRVFDRYGTLELGGVACECEAHTGLHISLENNYVEILENGRPTGPGETGDVVVTNLNNYGMPFIRYQIGDTSAWYDGPDCPCGRAAPMLQMVHGRLVESFQTRDGRMAWAGFAGAGYSNLAHPAIKQFQVVQKSFDLMTVRLVADAEVPQTALDEVTQAIQVAFGENVMVTYEYLDEIPALPSGKHQYAVSEIDQG